MVWYIHLSWRENVDTWFSTPTVCSSNHVVWDANFCKAKVEWMEHGVELHEVLEGNDGSTHAEY